MSWSKTLNDQMLQWMKLIVLSVWHWWDSLYISKFKHESLHKLYSWEWTRNQNESQLVPIYLQSRQEINSKNQNARQHQHSLQVSVGPEFVFVSNLKLKPTLRSIFECIKNLSKMYSALNCQRIAPIIFHIVMINYHCPFFILILLLQL
jgi:hypothetical protein